jgi:hypothetical protein
MTATWASFVVIDLESATDYFDTIAMLSTKNPF